MKLTPEIKADLLKKLKSGKSIRSPKRALVSEQQNPYQEPKVFSDLIQKSLAKYLLKNTDPYSRYK